MINVNGLLAPQIPHVKRLIDSIYTNGFGIDLSSTGTGKTFSACVVIREINQPTLVISPKSVIPAWERVLASFGVKDNTSIINYEKVIRGNTPIFKWKKNMPDILRPWKKDSVMEMPEIRIPHNTLVILDEGHKCKANDSSTAWLLIALVAQGYKVLMLSATAATSVMEMRAFGYLTKMHQLHDYVNFCRCHGAYGLGKYGSIVWDKESNEAKQAMMGIHEYLFNIKKCASRLTVDEFGDTFPENHVIPSAFDMGENGNKIARLYDEMEYELDRLEEKCENYSSHVFAVLMETRRRVEILKIPLIVEKIEDMFDEGKSIVVFVNFTDTVESISSRLQRMEKFNGKIAYVIGGQKSSERQQNIDDFQSDKKRVIICNIDAGSVGIGLHDLNGNYPRVALMSPTWKALSMYQAIGRIYRQGGKTKCLQYIVYAANCVEESICRKVENKINCLGTLNDGDLAETVRYAN